MSETCPTCTGPVVRMGDKVYSERSTAEFDQAARRLYYHRPEYGYPEVKDSACFECGLLLDEHAASEKGDYAHAFVSKPPDETPFFSESALYQMFGKDEARSIRALIRRIVLAGGGDPYELERESYKMTYDDYLSHYPADATPEEIAAAQ